MAQIAFIAQIPYLGFPGFMYQFFLGSMLNISLIGDPDVNLHFDYELGSSFKFQISHDIEGWIYGVNLIAIAGFVLLMQEIQNKKKAALKITELNPAN